MHTGPRRAPQAPHRNILEKGQTQMVNPGANLWCPLLPMAVVLSRSCVLNPSFPIREGQMQENVARIRGLKHALCREARSHLSETAPAEQIAAPG